MATNKFTYEDALKLYGLRDGEYDVNDLSKIYDMLVDNGYASPEDAVDAMAVLYDRLQVDAKAAKAEAKRAAKNASRFVNNDEARVDAMLDAQLGLGTEWTLPKVAAHLPYRLIFLALGWAIWCGMTDVATGLGYLFGFVVGGIILIITSLNVWFPFITDPIRDIVIDKACEISGKPREDGKEIKRKA